MQPHESGALFGHAQRDAQRTGSTVIIRVPLLLVPFSGLYSYASAASRQRVLKNGFSFFSSRVFKNTFWLLCAHPSPCWPFCAHRLNSA